MRSQHLDAGLVPWWASNPGIWTGYEITRFKLNLFIPSPPLVPYYLYLRRVLSPATLVVSFEPSTRNSWAGQCRAAATRLHIFGYYICSRFGSTESVISTYVYSGVNKSLVYPEIFVNKGYVVYAPVWFIKSAVIVKVVCYLHPFQTSTGLVQCIKFL